MRVPTARDSSGLAGPKQANLGANVGNVKVAIRARPLLSREIQANTKSVVSMKGHETTIRPDGATAKAHQGPRTFAFDECFWSATRDPSYAGQEQVYEKFGREFLNHSLEGYNSCILAYGQTGSGKSHTMLGTQDDPGIIPRICDELFQRIRNLEDNHVITLRMSFCEIYNEQVRDLLGSSNTTKLRVRESQTDGAYVEGLSEFMVKSEHQIMAYLEKGMKVRATAETNMNKQSSRSHAIFSLRMKQIISNTEGVTEEKTSIIRMVDLAGSERANETGATSDRLREGSNINKSLVTLGRVISALCEGSEKPTARRSIPYRDSTLTFLLKDSLGGNSKTAMIACISPTSYEQSLSTLRYADQARKITTKAKINQDILSSEDADARIKVMEKELASLQEALIRKSENSDQIAKITATVRFYEDQAAVLETQCKSLAAQNRAVKRHNELLSDYLREVTNKGITSMGPLAVGSFGEVEKYHSDVSQELKENKAEIQQTVASWQRILEAF